MESDQAVSKGAWREKLPHCFSKCFVFSSLGAKDFCLKRRQNHLAAGKRAENAPNLTRSDIRCILIHICATSGKGGVGKEKNMQPAPYRVRLQSRSTEYRGRIS